ncbi:MAG: hypothetical protein ACREBN_02115 [Burkholderiaceae bacterium]
MVEIATRYFPPGHPSRLKAIARKAFELQIGEGKFEEAVKLLRPEIELASTVPGMLDDVSYLSAKIELGRALCAGGEGFGEGIRLIWEIVDAVRTSHGAVSLQSELPLVSIAFCLREIGDRGSTDFDFQAYELAAARERPPSVNLMRRAETALYLALENRMLDRAGYFYQQALLNAESLPAGRIRERFIRRITPGHVAWLALTGEVDRAETIAKANADAVDDLHGAIMQIGRALAQRESGQFAAAIDIARQTEAAGLKRKNAAVVTDARVSLAATQLEAGDFAAALSWANKALEYQDQFSFDPPAADLGIVVGRARLANGRAREAIDPLREAYGFWLGHDPKSVWAAEAEYWLGRAYLASGDAKRGRWMVTEARQTLASSKLKSHQRLAQTEVPGATR